MEKYPAILIVQFQSVGKDAKLRLHSVGIKVGVANG